MTRKYAVLGKPISHSKSPTIHNSAFSFLGTDASYEAFEVGGDLEDFLGAHSDYSGISVTMPLKEEAYEFATDLDPIAKATRSVNTLLRTSDGWVGYNTDVYGITKSIEGIAVGKSMVLGAGATARSAIKALLDLGSDVSVWGRSLDKVSKLASEFGVSVTKQISQAAESNLVISTLPAGELDQYLSQIQAPNGALLDVAYDPWPSKAASLWQETGVAISGIEMLLWQAIAQQRLFAGLALKQQLPNEGELVSAVRSALSMAQ